MKHKTEWKKFEEENAKIVALKNDQRHLFPVGGQLALTSRLLPRNHEENTKLRKVLSHSIGCSISPVNIVQSPVVVNLVKHLAPRLSLPSNNTIQKDINMLADEQFLKNKSILTTALAYSLGVDGWSYNRRQCLAISCFAFLEDCSYKRVLIDLIEVDDQKADTVRESCKIVCRSLQLDENKLSAIVADNCSAMRAALRFFTLDCCCEPDDLDNTVLYTGVEQEEHDVLFVDELEDAIDEEDEEHIQYCKKSNMGRTIYIYGCLAHKVQLVIRDGFKARQIEEVILKVKNIVRLVRRPRFRKLIPTIPLANDTRWSSCYYMLEQYLKHYDLIQDVIQLVCPGTKIRVLTRSKSQFYESSEGQQLEVGLLKMTDLEKEILQEICTILKPFDIITQVLQLDEPCSFEFLPWYQNTIRKLTAVLELRKIRTKTRPFVQALIESLNKRFKEMEPVVVISAYLFPSYSFRKEIDYTYIIQGVTVIMQWVDEWREFNEELESSQSQSSQLMEYDNVFDDSQDIDNDEDNYVGLSLEEMMESCPRKKVKIVKQINNEKSLKKEMEEFETFITENGIKPNSLQSPFQEKGSFSNWWYINGHIFPILKRIAFAMYGIQPSNGGVERVFSYSKILVEGRRNRISIQSLRNRLLLLMNS